MNSNSANHVGETPAMLLPWQQKNPALHAVVCSRRVWTGIMNLDDNDTAN
jgi:hypothetical protein